MNSRERYTCALLLATHKATMQLASVLMTCFFKNLAAGEKQQISMLEDLHQSTMLANPLIA